MSELTVERVRRVLAARKKTVMDAPLLRQEELIIEWARGFDIPGFLLEKLDECRRDTLTEAIEKVRAEYGNSEDRTAVLRAVVTILEHLRNQK